MEEPIKNLWIEEARGIATQCWCDPKNSNKVIDVDLCNSIANKISYWMNTAAQNQRNTDYYKGLLIKCGESIGEQAYTDDSGEVQKDVLCAKIPELIKEKYEEKFKC